MKEYIKMNRKEKLINALKGLIGTVCIVVTAYCLMKYLNVKFHFLDIDNKPIDWDSFKVYRDAIFFYLPQTAWIQYVENRLIIILMVFGGPLVIGIIGMIGILLVVDGAKGYLTQLKKDAYRKKCELYQEELERYHYTYDY